MKIKEILNSVASLIGERGVLRYLTSFASTYADDGTEDYVTTKNMVEATNNVLSDIAQNYVAFVSCESVTPSDNKIYFTSLSKVAKEILSVYDELGEELSFTVYPEYIKVDSNVIKVKYLYVPSRFSLNDEVDVDTSKVTFSALVYGVASEFLLSICRFDEAIMWHEKFISALNSACKEAKISSVKNRKIKNRSFI